MSALRPELEELRADVRRLEGAADDLAAAQDRANELQARLDEVLTEVTGLLDRLVEFGKEAQRWTDANRNVR